MNVALRGEISTKIIHVDNYSAPPPQQACPVKPLFLELKSVPPMKRRKQLKGKGEMLRRWVPAHFGAVRRHICRSASTSTTSTSSAALYALWEKGLQQRAAGDLKGCAASFKACLARSNNKNTTTAATSAEKARAAADMRTVAEELGLVMLALEQPIAEAVTYFRMAVGEDDAADTSSSDAAAATEEE